MGAPIVLFGVFLNVLGSAFYIRDTLKGKTKPNRITWIMWAVAPLIGSAAAFSSGVTWATLPVLFSGLGPLTVVLASFVNRQSYWKLSAFDYLCGVFAILALVLWRVTGDPNIAIMFAIASDFAAAFPSLVKSWRHPETETALAYVLNGASNLTSFAATSEWTFASYAFPGYLVVVNAVFMIFILRKRGRSKESP